MSHSELALQALKKLFEDSQKFQAGLRVRIAEIKGAGLKPYHAMRHLPDKERYEFTLMSAQEMGAVELYWEGAANQARRIIRIRLKNLTQLSIFLGEPIYLDTYSQAEEMLSSHLLQYPVLREVLDQWRQLKKVRGHGPDRAIEWLQAAQTMEFLRFRHGNPGMPIRNLSVRLFKDSKLIERILMPIEVLATGNIESSGLDKASLLALTGLYKEEQPILMAGCVSVKRSRVTSLLDAPYSGLSPQSILGLGKTPPSRVLTIENLTTFHETAKSEFDMNTLLIYSAGMVSPAWREMYKRILRDLPSTVPLYHWGDIDEGGFRIASVIAQTARECGFTLQPFSMDPDEVSEKDRRPASLKTLERMREFAIKSGWPELGEKVYQAGFVVEQEALEP